MLCVESNLFLLLYLFLPFRFLLFVFPFLSLAIPDCFCLSLFIILLAWFSLPFEGISKAFQSDQENSSGYRFLLQMFNQFSEGHHEISAGLTLPFCEQKGSPSLFIPNYFSPRPYPEGSGLKVMLLTCLNGVQIPLHPPVPFLPLHSHCPTSDDPIY